MTLSDVHDFADLFFGLVDLEDMDDELKAKIAPRCFAISRAAVAERLGLVLLMSTRPQGVGDSDFDDGNYMQVWLRESSAEDAERLYRAARVLDVSPEQFQM